MSTYMCVSVCPSVREDISGTTRAILPTVMCTLPMAVARSSGRVTKSRGEGAVLMVFLHIAFAATAIIQSPITSCSRRDHSVCQASANRNPENSERRRCGLSAGNGGDGSTRRGRSLISTIALFSVVVCAVHWARYSVVQLLWRTFNVSRLLLQWPVASVQCNSNRKSPYRWQI